MIAFFVFVMTMEDDMRRPKLPVNSKENTITITSNGCCLWVEDIVFSLVDNDGNKTIIFKTDELWEYDIIHNDIPNVDYAPVKLLLELNYYYGEYYAFSEVFEFSDITALKRTGVLLYIQEADGAYINVLTGRIHVSYKLNYQPDGWDKLDSPMRIYSSR